MYGNSRHNTTRHNTTGPPAGCRQIGPARWRGAIALLVLGAAALASGNARAAQVDLSLNLFYANPAQSGSGGTWTVSAKTDEFGLLSAEILLKNILTLPGSIQNRGPSGIVNGNEPAGFRQPLVGNDDVLGFTRIQVYQVPSPGVPGDEPVFYGVGSIMNPGGGAPNYPGIPPGAVSTGPTIASLSNVNNIVWGNGDALGNPAWDSAAVLVGGSFAPGQTPMFFSTETLFSQAVVFTDTGTSSSAGASSDFTSTTVNTIVRSDLALLDGDYTGDGVVDAADYTVWRDSLGRTVPMGTGADGNNDGLVDALDYTVWKNNFGSTAGSLTASGPAGAAVPEPQTLVVAGFMAVCGIWARRSRRRNSAGGIVVSNLFCQKSLITGETA